jgi:hypothetical protein
MRVTTLGTANCGYRAIPENTQVQVLPGEKSAVFKQDFILNNLLWAQIITAIARAGIISEKLKSKSRNERVSAAFTFKKNLLY